MSRRVLLAAVGLMPAGAEPADHSDAGKTRFTLWNPVPRERLRELSTDRPDQTESPFTVDAGHVQIEMDMVSFTRDDDDGETVEEWNVAPVNLKVGLRHNLDLQLVFGGWVQSETTGDTGTVRRVGGFSDLTVRAKLNLWGNDSGSTALALMPFATFPLGSDEVSRDEFEGGIIVPFGWSFADGFYLGLMSEIDVLANEEGDHNLAWLNSVTLGSDVTNRLGVYIEVVGVARRDGPWTGQLDGGLTFACTENIQLDAGCNFGLTDSAPDRQPFIGLTIRF
jgi:hypothetical protein